ncbi:MAG: hypothetical protein ACK5XS_09670 [Armatimonadota bacterium]|jgi:hypothetical protein|nr:hypothetical protein [Fimbriimonadaceae bacterium]MCZ8138269.1 hypothetical protein [Fimbriimonadaceae bacterium]
MLFLAPCASAQSDTEQGELGDVKPWRQFFSKIEQPILIDINGLFGPQTAGRSVIGGVEREGEIVPIEPGLVNLWAQANSRRVVAKPGGYILRRTRNNPEFGATNKRFWMLDWLSGMSEDQLASLASGKAVGDLDPRGQMVVTTLANSLTGGYGGLTNKENSFKAQVAANVDLFMTLPSGQGSMHSILSHKRTWDELKGPPIEGSPLPPFEPAPNNPKSVILDFKEGELATLEDILLRLFREAGIWVIPDRRHMPEPIFIKGKWDSYALAEAIKIYHEVEPVFVGDYAEEVAKFAKSFDEALETLSRDATDEFRRLLKMAEDGQTLTWSQLQQEFPETAASWQFLQGQEPQASTKIRLEHYVTIGVTGRDKNGNVLPNSVTFGTPRPTTSPQ